MELPSRWVPTGVASVSIWSLSGPQVLTLGRTVDHGWPASLSRGFTAVNDTSSAIALASTFISSIALAGVMVSLLLQARQLRLERIQAHRQLHLELIRIRLENPDLPDPYPRPFPNTGSAHGTDPRRHMFMNWRTKYFEFGFVIGELSAGSVRQYSAAVFADEEWREWWRIGRPVYQEDANTRRKRQYFAIVDAEYAKSLQTAAAGVEPNQEK